MRRVSLIIFFIMLISLMITACSTPEEGAPDPSPEQETPGLSEPERDIEQQEPDEETVVVPDPIYVTLSAVGDIMVHSTQLPAQLNDQTNQYDFSNNFQYIKPYIQRADLALANLETTFAGAERGFSGYPVFNTPDELAPALKEAGFNVISTSNNHSLDTGKSGLIRTVDVLKEHGLDVIGTRRHEQEDTFVIKDVKGVKVGLSAYTYETPRQGDQKSINGIVMSPEVAALIDSFSYDHLDEELSLMEARINKMKEEGAELIVFFMHWGNEYQLEPSSYQQEIAQSLSNLGVDIIFGSHPHVIQPIDIIQSEVDDRETVVVYSMGNIISNQRYEFLDTRYTEDGIIVNVTVKKDVEEERISIEEVSYVPTWVHLYQSGSKRVYEILPLLDALENPQQFNLVHEDNKWRAQNSHQNTLGLIEKSTEVIKEAPVLSEQEIEVILQE